MQQYQNDLPGSAESTYPDCVLAGIGLSDSLEEGQDHLAGASQENDWKLEELL